MTAQYWVGDFFVDLTRNQITQKTQSQTIPPKALAVLTYLAKNANTVVSQEDLLSEVWPNTVVTPNTLQRSIAQLRKALGKDSQIQPYIKTHAKQGYSLEVEVRWQDNEKIQSTSFDENISDVDKVFTREIVSADISEPTANKQPSQKSTWSALHILITAVCVVFVVTIIAKYFSTEQPLDFSIAELRSLTATDNKELAGIYSPDGKYVVFLRYSDQFCMNNAWAKDTTTQEEIQLTNSIGSYGSHSFSKDGKELVFIESENCSEPITQKKCYRLMSFDFQKALKEPQSPIVLLECKNSKISRPQWLNNNDIALMQSFSTHRQLISYSIANNSSSVIYEQQNGNIIDFDYSPSKDLIALTSLHSDGQHYIEILKPDGQILSSNKIEYPKEITNQRKIFPNFMPDNEQLIFSTGRQLFTLSYTGKITNISLPLDEPMSTPTFHPNGKRMIVIKGHYDSDIAKISRSQMDILQVRNTQENDDHSVPNTTIIERSILGEDNAIFQPSGELIAFKSGRSGAEQLWVTNGRNRVQQLSHFPMDNYIFGLDWAADGQSVLVNANGELAQVFLDSTQNFIPFPHPIRQLFQWDSKNETALLKANIKGILKFVEFDLKSSKFRIVTDKLVKWALKSEDGRLIYTDHLNRFWQPGPAEDQLITALENQGSKKQFLIKDNVIYGINEKFKFWSYDLNKQTFQIIGNAPQNTDDLTDIDQSDILISVRISAKKELAELILRD